MTTLADLLREAVRRGALSGWRDTPEGLVLFTETRSYTLPAYSRSAHPAEQHDPVPYAPASSATEGAAFLHGLRLGLAGFAPLDVEEDYRPALKHRDVVRIPRLAVTPRTRYDLLAAAHSVRPGAHLTVTTTDEGDLEARISGG